MVNVIKRFAASALAAAVGVTGAVALGASAATAADSGHLVVSFYKDGDRDNIIGPDELQVGAAGYVYVKDAAGNWWMTSDSDRGGDYSFAGLAPGTAEVYFPIANPRAQYFNDADISRLPAVAIDSAPATFISPSDGSTMTAKVSAGTYPMATVDVPANSFENPTMFRAGFSQVTANAQVVLDGETTGRDDLAEISFIDGAGRAEAMFGAGTADQYHAMDSATEEHRFLDPEMGVAVTPKPGYRVQSVVAIEGNNEIAVVDLGNGEYIIYRPELADIASQPTFRVTMEPAPTETPTPTPTETETPVDEDPFVVVEKPVYTEAESTQGIGWFTSGWNPVGEAVEAYLVFPNGERTSFDVELDETGNASGNLTWAEFDENGNVIRDNLEFPAGDYTVYIAQGDKSVTTEFTVGDNGAQEPGASASEGASPSATSSAAAGEGATAGDGNELAATGAENLGVIVTFGVISIIAGSSLVLKRRNA